MRNKFSNHASFVPREEHSNVSMPQLIRDIRAGFPSPADDYIDNSLDLNEYLIKNKAASFFVRVAGDSMQGAGIMDGDILLVDKSLDPGHNKIVVAILNNEMTLKRLSFRKDKVYLVPENSNYQPIEITEYMDCSIWGVVSAVVRKM